MTAPLIAQLQALTGPDRELDEAVAMAVLNPAGELRLGGMPSGETGIKTYFYPDGTRGTALRYTSSLDAALTLIPDGWHWSAGYRDNAPHYGFTLDGPKDEEIDGDHNSPAIALCIASLKARSVVHD